MYSTAACLPGTCEGLAVQGGIQVRAVRAERTLGRSAVTWTGLMSGVAGMLPFPVLTAFRICRNAAA